MRNKKIITLMLALWVPVAAQAMPAVEATTLPQGVPLWVMEDHTLPIVSLAFTFRAAGSVSDPTQKEGRAKLAAEMLTKGAGKYDAVGFEERLGEIAADVHVHADDDNVTLRVRCLREFLPQALKLVKAALTKPRFDEAELTHARAEQVLQLQNVLENPSYRALEQLNARAYQGHPYAQPALGSKTSIESIVAEDLRAYQQTYLTAANLGVAAAGDVAAADLVQFIAPLVNALPRGLSNEAATVKAPMQGAGEVLHHRMNLPQSQIMFAMPWPVRSDDDFYAAYVLQTMLGGSPLQSILGEAIRQKDGLVYDVSTQLVMRDGGVMLLGNAGTRNANVTTVQARIKSVLSELQQKGVSQEACEDAKAYIIGSMPIQLDSTPNMVAMLAMMQHENLGTDYLERRRELFESVRCTEVSEAAANWLNPEHALFSIAGGVAE